MKSFTVDLQGEIYIIVISGGIYTVHENGGEFYEVQPIHSNEHAAILLIKGYFVSLDLYFNSFSFVFDEYDKAERNSTNTYRMAIVDVYSKENKLGKYNLST